jgi:hypothetical protein
VESLRNSDKILEVPTIVPYKKILVIPLIYMYSLRLPSLLIFKCNKTFINSIVEYPQKPVYIQFKILIANITLETT